MPDSESRTEAATPARLSKARDEGQAPVSRELPTFAGLGVGVATLMIFGPISAARLCSVFATIIQRSADATSPIDIAFILEQSFRAGLMVVGPIAVAIAGATVAAGLLQTGFQIRRSMIRLHIERLSPLSGLRSLLGVSHGVEAGKSLLKLVVLGSISGIYRSCPSTWWKLGCN